MIKENLSKNWIAKAISAVLMVMLIMTMIPTMAFASTAQTKTDSIVLGGQTVNAGDKNKPVPNATKGTYSFDGKKLTLSNVVYKPAEATRSPGDFLYSSSSEALTIELKGNNVVTTSSRAQYAIVFDGRQTSTITGSGNLTVSGPSAGALRTYNDFTMNGTGTVTFHTLGAGGLSYHAPLYVDGQINVNKGNLICQTDSEGGMIGGKAMALASDGKINMGTGVKIVTPKNGTIKELDLQSLGANNVFFTVCEGTTDTPAKKVQIGKSGSTPPAAKKPAAPKPTAKAINSTTAKVAWSKVSGATSYLVYVASSKNGTYNLMETVKGTSATLDYLQRNKTYYFKVRAKNAAGISGYSKVVSVKTTTKKPNTSKCTCGQDHSKAWFTLKQVSKSDIRVTWKPQSGAKLYQVANNHTGNKKMKIKWTGNNGQHCYLSIGKAKGKNYQFRMRTVKTKNGKRVYGSWSSKVCITMK